MRFILEIDFDGAKFGNDSPTVAISNILHGMGEVVLEPEPPFTIHKIVDDNGRIVGAWMFTKEPSR